MTITAVESKPRPNGGWWFGNLEGAGEHGWLWNRRMVGFVQTNKVVQAAFNHPTWEVVTILHLDDQESFLLLALLLLLILGGGETSPGASSGLLVLVFDLYVLGCEGVGQDDDLEEEGRNHISQFALTTDPPVVLVTSRTKGK